LHPFAITECGIGVVNLLCDSKFPDSSSLHQLPSHNGVSTQAVTTTLDLFDELCGSGKDIVLWMDIEGSELAALKGGVSLLSSGRVKAINLEVRDNSECEDWPTAKEIHEFLTKFNYVKALKYLDQKTHYDVVYVLDPTVKEPQDD